MHNRYLEKIAAEDNTNNYKSLAAGAGLISAGKLSGLAGSDLLKYVAENPSKRGNYFTGADVRRMRKDYNLGRDSVVTTRDSYKSPEWMSAFGKEHVEYLRRKHKIDPDHLTSLNSSNKSGPYAVPKRMMEALDFTSAPKDIVSLPKHKYGRSIPVAMHEYGHIIDARNRSKSGIIADAKGRMNIRTSPGKIPVLGFLAGGLAGSISDHGSIALPAAAALASHHLWAPEIRANYYAAKSLVKHRGGKAGLMYTAAVAPGFMTYLKKPLKDAGIASLGVQAGKFVRKHTQEN